MTKLCCFEQDKPPFLSMPSTVFTGSCWWLSKCNTICCLWPGSNIGIIHKYITSRCYLLQILGAMISEINGSALLGVSNVPIYLKPAYQLYVICYTVHHLSVKHRHQTHRVARQTYLFALVLFELVCVDVLCKWCFTRS